MVIKFPLSMRTSLLLTLVVTPFFGMIVADVFSINPYGLLASGYLALWFSFKDEWKSLAGINK
jgi:hypothetical protein